jgi:hypothetical protein
MQTVKAVIDSNKLETLIQLPASFRNVKLEVTIRPLAVQQIAPKKTANKSGASLVEFFQNSPLSDMDDILFERDKSTVLRGTPVELPY